MGRQLKRRPVSGAYGFPFKDVDGVVLIVFLMQNYTNPISKRLPNTWAIFSSVLMVGLAFRGFSRR